MSRYTRGTDSDEVARRIIYRDGAPVAIAYDGIRTYDEGARDMQELVRVANIGLTVEERREEILRLFAEAGTGLRYDPSWSRPKRLTERERKESYDQARGLLENL